jgi:tRNA (mo5U34)-methyltransferase
MDLNRNDMFWWHSIDLGDQVTPGHKSPERLDWEWENLRLPPLAGRSVLDVGAWDGYFSFRAERGGAKRVVALDHYVWSLDLPRQQAYWRDCAERGITPQPYHERAELWHPTTLPGRAAFDFAHAKLGSRVEPVVADFATMDIDQLGSFDIVLFLGVIYHLEEPLTALRRLRTVTRSLAVIESEAITVPDKRSLWELVPGAELNADVGNWWVPTEAGLHALVRGAGFTQAETVAASPPGDDGHFRIFVHATP